MRAALASSSAPPPPPSVSAAAALLAPGFRFHPTDEELVSYYLKRRVSGRALALDAIAEVDLYKREPWELPGLSWLRSRDLEWYFFSPLDRKYAKLSRTNRATALGYWKTTGKDRSVCRGTRVVGMKKTLVYHAGRAPRGTRTNWVMHEYRLVDEELAKSGIRQDAYVVCRIFQKTGAGPQNGAQYGAPFVDEEWNDEEAADGLLIIPDGADGETNDGNDKNYLIMDEVRQSQDMSNQQERPDALLVDNDGKGSGNDDPPGDPTIFLDEIFKDPSFIHDVVDCINQSDIQSSPTLIEDSGEQILSGDPPSQVDGYLELNDLQDAEIMDYSTMNFVIEGGNGHLEQLETEFFDTTDLLPNEQKLLQMSPVENNINGLTDYLISLTDGCGSYEQANNIVHSSTTDWPSFEFDDEFLLYFDAVDDDLQQNFACFAESMEHHNPSTLNQSNSKVDGGNGTTNWAIPQLPSADVGGGTSSAFPASDDQFKNKYQHVPVVSGADVTVNADGNKPIQSRLVNMLDSISAPPAFAAEFPPSFEKYVGQISGTYQASQLHVSPSLIHLNDSEVWPLHKKGTADLLLSYSIADNVGRKSSGFGPFRKIQDWTVSLLLQGGCYHFFLSALVLLVGYKVGMCIHGK